MKRRAVKNLRHKLSTLKCRHATERRIKRMEQKLDKRLAYVSKLEAQAEQLGKLLESKRQELVEELKETVK